MDYNRTVAQLEAKAIKFWSRELTEKEAAVSIIPLLIKTQEKFISLLDLAEADPEAWKDALKLQANSELTSNLFLKHLMVLADFGGEQLQRLSFKEIFPKGVMTYIWREKQYTYQLKATDKIKRLNNKMLHVDGEGLLKRYQLDAKMEDIIMILLYAGSCVDGNVPEHVQEKCIIGNLIGQTHELQKFVKERYIWVSRITGGATSNKLGQIAQQHVKSTLREALQNWQFLSTIPGISQNAGNTDTSFDVVAKSPSGKYVAIEVSFQVTTNSVIERKSGQAQRRAELLHQNGHKIAYVIDGAGNFQRNSALRNICNFSDCTVAFSADELQVLVQFLKDYEENKL